MGVDVCVCVWVLVWVLVWVYTDRFGVGVMHPRNIYGPIRRGSNLRQRKEKKGKFVLFYDASMVNVTCYHHIGYSFL